MRILTIILLVAMIVVFTYSHIVDQQPDANANMSSLPWLLLGCILLVATIISGAITFFLK